MPAEHAATGSAEEPDAEEPDAEEPDAEEPDTEESDTEESDTEETEEPAGGHAAPEGAPLHPLIDLSRDPTPGKPDHARPDGD